MEALDYHIERWETISSKYFKSFETEGATMKRPYSYVVNSVKYICEADRDLSFYYETGISYQVRDLLLMIVKDPDKTNENILDKEKLYWMEYDDKLYLIEVREKISIFLTKDMYGNFEENKIKKIKDFEDYKSVWHYFYNKIFK